MKSAGHIRTVLWVLAGLVSAASGQRTVPATGPATHPAGAMTGSVFIEAIQGTKDGPPVGGDVVSLEMLHSGGHVKTVKTRLDASGRAVIEGLPLAEPFRPRVTVQHAGGEYQAVGPVVSRTRPTQKIVVKVFETTDQVPAWDVPMRHVMLLPSPHGLLVREMLAVRNPTDRAWLGRTGPGQQSSMVLRIPAAATEIKLSGAFHTCCSKIIDGAVVSTRPMAPGISQYRVSYVLASPEGRAALEITAPAPVKRLMVFLPEGQGTLEADGLKRGDVLSVRDKPMRAYEASDLPVGDRRSVTVGGLSREASPAEQAAASSTLPKMLVIVGGIVMLILIIVVLVKPRRKAAPGQAEAENQAP